MTPDQLKQEIHAGLEETRARTWHLMAGFSESMLAEAATDYLSPPVWDLGHIANFEELWLVQNILECRELHEGFNDTYDAFKHERSERPNLSLLDREGARQYMEEVRARTRRVLNELDMDCSRLTRDGFVHWMIVLHEQQHQETLLQSITMRGASEQYELPKVRRLPEPKPTTHAWLPGPRQSQIGVDAQPGHYDNESPSHSIDLDAFEIAKYPVTTGEYLAFMEAGGYDNQDYWSQRGRQWLDDTDHHAPLYWRLEDQWRRIGYGCRVPIKQYPDEILCNISYFEAEAYANWASTRPGMSRARLPTEHEWEAAARTSPQTGTSTLNPWGESAATTDVANIDQLAFTTSRLGAYPNGAAPCGAEHMIGDVWEWTSSGFDAYAGFTAFPYDEYSKVFFGGDYRVLRGGSWATRAGCATATFRNWDHPYRRQIFAGLRLARSA